VWAVGSVDPRGSGKTTAARALAARLVAEGRRVGVVVRGYGRPSGGLGLSWALRPGDARAAAWTLGDEGALFADDGLLVAAGDRAEAGAALVGAGCDTIVVDDGLPTRGILADHRVAVVDGRRPLAGGPQPAGDARVVGPLPGDVDEAWVLYASDALNLAVPWRAARREVLPWRGVAPREGEPLFAFAGIGRPASFFAGLGPALTGWRALHDHDPLSDETLRRIQEEAAGRAIVCTAKDAVRLPDRWRARVGWRDVQLTLGPTMGEGR